MPPVAHVITTLDVGGAEKLLANLVRHGDDTVLVVSLRAPGPVADELRATGVEVVGLGLRHPAGFYSGVAALTRVLRRVRPAVVQTWLYHADVLGGLAARRAGVPALAWSLHASELPAGAVPRHTRIARSAGARLSSRWPDAIVCTSEATRIEHVRLGYDATKLTVIRNGVSPTSPDPAAGRAVRAELGIPKDAEVVLRVARYDPQKDWPALVAAWQRLAPTHPSAHLVACGRGVIAAAPDLRALIRGPGAARVHLLGERDDVAALHAAADVAVSSSAYGETFPLVIGEAMAAGVPVVTTDVGDCALLVGDTGRVVPPGDPDRLAAAIGELLSDAGQRRDLGDAARQRVTTRFTIQHTAAAYHALHTRLADEAQTQDGAS